MSGATQPSIPATAALSGLLQNSARELSRIGDQLEDLQKTLSVFLTAPSRAALSTGTAGLQSLDSVTQHVRALSDLYARLEGSNMDDADVARAVDQISLSALAVRLSCTDCADNSCETPSSVVIF